MDTSSMTMKDGYVASPGGTPMDREDAGRAVTAHIRSFAYRPTKPVLQRLDLEVGNNEAVAVLGPSGCGKSTLIRLLSGLLPRGSGECLEGNVSLFGALPEVYRSRGKLAVMFQDPALLPHISVEDNIALPLDLLKREGSADVDGLLRLVGLQDFRHYLPRDLSGGMRTRTALARTFVSKPQLAFLDEPFTGLDLGWRESLYASLQELRVRCGTTVLMVTHDLQEAVYNSDRVLVMRGNGTFIEQFRVPGTIPRDYRFGETVARHTVLLSTLAQLFGGPPSMEVT